jgi:hypothetical protein
MVSTTTSLSLRVSSARREISSIKSAFVMASVLHIYFLFGNRNAYLKPPLQRE